MRIMIDADNREGVKIVEACHFDVETNTHDNSKRLIIHLSNGQNISILNEDYVDVEKLLADINKTIFKEGKYYIDCLDYRFV